MPSNTVGIQLPSYGSTAMLSGKMLNPHTLGVRGGGWDTKASEPWYNVSRPLEKYVSTSVRGDQYTPVQFLWMHELRTRIYNEIHDGVNWDVSTWSWFQNMASGGTGVGNYTYLGAVLRIRHLNSGVWSGKEWLIGFYLGRVYFNILDGSTGSSQYWTDTTYGPVWEDTHFLFQQEAINDATPPIASVYNASITTHQLYSYYGTTDSHGGLFLHYNDKGTSTNTYDYDSGVGNNGFDENTANGNGILTNWNAGLPTATSYSGPSKIATRNSATQTFFPTSLPGMFYGFEAEPADHNLMNMALLVNHELPFISLWQSDREGDLRSITYAGEIIDPIQTGDTSESGIYMLGGTATNYENPLHCYDVDGTTRKRFINYGGSHSDYSDMNQPNPNGTYDFNPRRIIDGSLYKGSFKTDALREQGPAVDWAQSTSGPKVFQGPQGPMVRVFNLNNGAWRYHTFVYADNIPFIEGSLYPSINYFPPEEPSS